MQNKYWRPLKIGGSRRLPSLPNGRTGPGLLKESLLITDSLLIVYSWLSPLLIKL